MLRAEFHAAIKARHLSRATVAADLGVSKGSICGWLLPDGAPPSAGNIGKIRRWLSSAPKPAPETPADAADWPGLRDRLQAVVRERALSHAELGRVFEVEPGTVEAWLAKSHEKRSPGPRSMLRIAEWLREGAVVPAAAPAGPPYVLDIAERDLLAGHLSLGANRELRQQFGATVELLQKAATGAHLDGEVIARLRASLANGAAE